MSVCLTPPTFPVIESTPGFLRSLGTARVKDWLIAGGITLSMLPIGYLIGKPLRKHVMSILVMCGGVAGVMLVSQNSSFRLMGLRENAREVERYYNKRQHE